MKKYLPLLIVFLILDIHVSYSQKTDVLKHNTEKPFLIVPESHDPDFKHIPLISFYQNQPAAHYLIRKQHISCSTLLLLSPMLSALLLTLGEFLPDCHTQ